MSQATPEEVNRAVSKDLKARGITQQQVADKIGKSRSMVANQLSSKKRFSKQMAALFANAYGYSSQYLLYGEGSMMSELYQRERRIIHDVVSIPTPDVVKGDLDDTTIFACLLDVAEGILRVIGDEDALEAWLQVKRGCFTGYLDSMKKLSNRHRGYSYSPILAKIACDRIKYTIDYPIEEFEDSPKNN